MSNSNIIPRDFNHKISSLFYFQIFAKSLFFAIFMGALTRLLGAYSYKIECYFYAGAVKHMKLFSQKVTCKFITNNPTYIAVGALSSWYSCYAKIRSTNSTLFHLFRKISSYKKRCIYRDIALSFAVQMCNQINNKSFLYSFNETHCCIFLALF